MGGKGEATLQLGKARAYKCQTLGQNSGIFPGIDFIYIASNLSVNS